MRGKFHPVGHLYNLAPYTLLCEHPALSAQQVPKDFRTRLSAVRCMISVDALQTKSDARTTTYMYTAKHYINIKADENFCTKMNVKNIFKNLIKTYTERSHFYSEFLK